jgi:aspartate racemase
MNPLELIIEELTCNPEFAGRKNIGVIATTGFITSRILHRKLEPLGFKIISLNAMEQEKFFMQPLYRAEGIKSGVINDEIRSLFRHQVPLLKEKGAEVIIGACSEVPLLINSANDIPFIDAIELLARKTIEYCYTSQVSIY